MKHKNVGEFAKVFGINPRNRIIEFFLEMRGMDFSIGDVARETKLNRATAYNAVEELNKTKFIIPTRKVSGSQLYKLNAEKEEVKVLIEVFDILLKNIVKENQTSRKLYA